MPDAWLLDHVFQAIADRLAGWTSCFSLARLAGVVGTAALLVEARLTAQPGALLLALVQLPVVIAVSLIFGHFRRGLANSGRLLLCPARLVSLASVAWNLIMVTQSRQSLLTLIDIAAYGCALYFASCSPRPPVPRVARGWAVA